MKKILINFLYWGAKESGIYRVGFNIIKNLSEITEDKLFCITNYYNDINFENIEVIPKDFKIKTKIPKAIEAQIYLLKILKKIKPDLIFSPFHYGIIFKKIKQICIVHDLIPLTVFKERFATYIYHKFFLKKYCDNCKFIIVPSNATKEDLIKIFKIKKEKINVVYLGVEEKFKKLNLNKEDFYLIVNASFPYKNVDFVIKIWKEFNIEDKLKIVGSNPKFIKYNNYLKNLVRELKIEDKIEFYEKVSDEELIEFYNKAKGLISASLKEGFNLPPLEALSCGTPVILSDISVHREIYSDIGIFFDLNKSETFLDCLKIIEKLDLEEFDKKRKIFLEKFNWRKTAERIYEIFYQSF